ncbi:TPA: hypothetical protein QHC28_004739 [Aeromonas veronii bv. veronii]|nr:hypothetical protein [Aeromonas veronii bv. veronii]
MSNIEKFDDIAAETFAILYERFPLPCYIAVEHFTEGRQAYEDIDHGGQMPTDEARLIDATFVWLVDAGYIKGNVNRHIGIGQAVLTAKGLETLKATPDSLTAPMGERIKDAVKQDGRDVARSLVSQALSIGLSLGVNALK